MNEEKFVEEKQTWIQKNIPCNPYQLKKRHDIEDWIGVEVDEMKEELNNVEIFLEFHYYCCPFLVGSCNDFLYIDAYIVETRKINGNGNDDD